jgi:hypothetical protein
MVPKYHTEGTVKPEPPKYHTPLIPDVYLIYLASQILCHTQTP